ncbi:MAG: hypothetical protein ACI9TY_001345 [Alphaproteobacteria bacterium]|jgi:hypothetical protein
MHDAYSSLFKHQINIEKRIKTIKIASIPLQTLIDEKMPTAIIVDAVGAEIGISKGRPDTHQ